MKHTNSIFNRTELLFGESAMEKLANSSVIVFGIGGVGGHAAEAIVRSGIGSITLVDNDRVDITNINRQLFATLDKVGKYKTEAAYERLKQINPECNILLHNIFYLPDTSKDIDLSCYDYIVDAIDTVTGKIEIAVNGYKAGIPVISSMGTGNKRHPSMLEISDIYDTEICPLARIMRRELRKREIPELKVVYSKEIPNSKITMKNESGRQIPASSAFVPAAAGLLIASEVVNHITESRRIG